MNTTYDLIIIGAGPAGLTAAIYAVRYNLKTLVIGEMIGGQMTEVNVIENYPGVPQISGLELGQRMFDQAKNLGMEFRGESVETIKKNSDQTFAVTTSTSQTFTSKSLILTSGTEPKRLDLPGEKQLRGRGISYCVTCDGPLFKNKTVAVVGGGDAAFTGALELAGYCAKVYLIHRRSEFKAKPSFVEQVKAHPKITLITPISPISLTGTTKLEKLVLNQPFQGRPELPVDGLFVEIGSLPSTRLTDQLKLTKDEYNFVAVKTDQSTAVPGVFAAGDITTGSNRLRQITTATAEGTIAAQSAYHYIQSLNISPISLIPPIPQIDPTRCIGCGICVNLAPQVFAMDDVTGLAKVKNSPDLSDEARLKLAVDSCPENALSFRA